MQLNCVVYYPDFGMLDKWVLRLVRKSSGLQGWGGYGRSRWEFTGAWSGWGQSSQRARVTIHEAKTERDLARLKERGIGFSDLIIARLGAEVGREAQLGPQWMESTNWLKAVCVAGSHLFTRWNFYKDGSTEVHFCPCLFGRSVSVRWNKANVLIEFSQGYFFSKSGIGKKRDVTTLSSQPQGHLSN